jgi:hypothetical protein
VGRSSAPKGLRGRYHVLNNVALSVQFNMKADLQEIYGASTRAAAQAAIDVFADKYGAKYEKAVACLTKGRGFLCAAGRGWPRPPGAGRGASLFWIDVGSPDHFAPLHRLVGDELAELGG